MKSLRSLVKKEKKIKVGSPEHHQHKILVDTVKNPNKSLMGGPSVKEAKEALKNKFKYTDDEIKGLEKQDAMGQMANSVRNAFGMTSTPPPTTPPPATSDPKGSLASTITGTVGKLMGKDEMNPVPKPSLRQRFGKLLGGGTVRKDQPIIKSEEHSGKAIGHIKSGKPVYHSDTWAEHVQQHKDFTAEEHLEAGRLHRDLSDKSSTKSEEKEHDKARKFHSSSFNDKFSLNKSEEIMKQFKNLNKTELVKVLKEVAESIKELAEEQTKLIKSELAKGCIPKLKPSLGKEEIEAIQKRHDGMIPDGHEDKPIMIQHVGRLYRKGMIGDAMRLHRKHISRKKV